MTIGGYWRGYIDLDVRPTLGKLKITEPTTHFCVHGKDTLG